MCGAEIELSRLENHLHRLRQALQPLRDGDGHELIVVDCPPSLGILTLNAFAAADHLIVPLQCEYYALEGVAMINRILGQIRESGTNASLELLGVLMTMFDGRTNLSHQVVGEVRQHFGPVVFETVIPRTTRLAEAPSFGKPIIYYDKYSTGAAAYEVLTQEVLARLKI
jgi:chromosome partitioning protein